jgi:hypothetical protein
MPAPFFTTNDSEISRLEGLYIKERNPPASISGAFLGVTGIVGDAIRGPVDLPIEVTSPGQFAAIFGGRDQGSGGPVVSSLWKALANKPFGKLVVVRAAAAAAVAATFTLHDGGGTPVNILRVDATSVGAWGNNVTVYATAPTDGVTGHFNLVAKYLGKTYTFKNLDLTGTNDNSLSIVGTDPSNVIKITKLAGGTPSFSVWTSSAPASLASGAEGTLADSDFTAANRGLNVLASYKGIGCVFVAERSSTSLKSYMQTLAAGATDRVFLAGPDNETVAVSAVSTELNGGSFHALDRVVYCHNHPYTLDPETATEMLTRPESWMASVLSQIDVDIHPGEEDTKQFTAGITRLYWPALSREDYITLRNAGACSLEQDDGFAFVSGVTTCLVPGKEQITRRRMADYLQISVANFLKHLVKKKNTDTRKTAAAGIIDSFLGNLQENERVVKRFSVDPDILNNPVDEGNGIVRLFMRVRLISHMLELVLETEIGTQVQIKEAA